MPLDRAEQMKRVDKAMDSAVRAMAAMARSTDREQERTWYAQDRANELKGWVGYVVKYRNR